MIKSKMMKLSMVVSMMLLTSCQSTQHQANNNTAVISTTVATTEVLDQLDVTLVGKPTTSESLPDKYQSVPEIGQAKNLDVEKIKVLKPTKVLSLESIRAETQDTFKQIGIEADYYNFDTVDKMMNAITQMGQDFNRTAQAKKLNERFQHTLQQIKSQHVKKRPKVLVLMGVPGSYLVATNQSYIGNMVELLGAENVVQSQDTAYLSSNTEYLNSVKPDIILRQAHAMPKQVTTMFNEQFKTNQIWKNMPAVKTNQVYDLNPKLFGINARINADEAMKELYYILYGVQLHDEK